MKVRRRRHRCPECKSNNIYRRTFSYAYTEKSKKKGRRKIGDVRDVDAFKKYRCIACGNRFDIPIVE